MNGAKLTIYKQQLRCPPLSLQKHCLCLRRSNLLFTARTALLSLQPHVATLARSTHALRLNCMHEREAQFPAPTLLAPSTGNNESWNLSSTIQCNYHGNQPHSALLPKSAVPSRILPSYLHTRLPAAARAPPDAPCSCGSSSRVPALVLPFTHPYVVETGVKSWPALLWSASPSTGECLRTSIAYAT